MLFRSIRSVVPRDAGEQIFQRVALCAVVRVAALIAAQWPAYNEEYLKEDTINYTISFNGKARFNMEFAADETSDAIQAAVLADERSQKWIEGKTPKKIIVVPKKIVNVVI